MNSAPTSRTVCQHSGTIASAVSEIDRTADELTAMREDFARAYGHYDCACGGDYDFTFDAPTLDDYAALNRWLGQHSRCGEAGEGRANVTFNELLDAFDDVGINLSALVIEPLDVVFDILGLDTGDDDQDLADEPIVAIVTRVHTALVELAHPKGGAL